MRKTGGVILRIVLFLGLLGILDATALAGGGIMPEPNGPGSVTSAQAAQ